MGMGMTIPSTFIYANKDKALDRLAAQIARVEYKNESIDYVKYLISSGQI